MSPRPVHRFRSIAAAPQFSLRWLLGFVTGIGVMCGVGRQWGLHAVFGLTFLVLGLILVVSLAVFLPWRITLAGVIGAILSSISLIASPYELRLWWPGDMIGGIAIALWLARDWDSSRRLKGMPIGPSAAWPSLFRSPGWLRIAVPAVALAIVLLVGFIACKLPIAGIDRAGLSWSNVLDMLVTETASEYKMAGIGMFVWPILLMWPAHVFAILAIACSWRRVGRASDYFVPPADQFALAVAQSLSLLFLALGSTECFLTTAIRSASANIYRYGPDYVLSNFCRALIINWSLGGTLVAISLAISGRHCRTLLRLHGWLIALGLTALISVALLATCLVCLVELGLP